jgi:hypothetical protein
MDPRIPHPTKHKGGPEGIDLDALEAFERGEGALADALRIDEEDLDLFRGRGLALLEGGKLDDARSVLEMCQMLGDADPAICIALAACTHLLGDDREARAHLEVGLLRAREVGDEDLIAAATEWGTSSLPAAFAEGSES